MHDGIRHTRGAAGAVAEIRPRQRLVKFAGVGNISASICATGHMRHAVSLNGTLGHEARTFREYPYPWEADALLVMHSDGLRLALVAGRLSRPAPAPSGARRRRAVSRFQPAARRCDGRRRDGRPRERAPAVGPHPRTNTTSSRARRRARQIAAALGFDAPEQTRIATAVSELARNAFQYARRRLGRVRSSKARCAPQVLIIRVADQGPGIANLDAVLSGQLPVARPAWVSASSARGG